MFLIYQSSQLNVLLDEICKIMLEKPLSNPLQSEYFLVNNIETSYWIQLYIAKKLKISANIKFFTPQQFIWKLLNNIIPNMSKNIILNKSIMTWTIMELLENNKINHLINTKDNLYKKFMFSSNISNLFEQYLIYRPQMIYNWKKKINIHHFNEEEKWQKTLWKKIIKHHQKNNIVLDHTMLLTNFLSKINKIKSKLLLFPSRLFIFEISDIPISLLTILYNISNKYTINLLCVTPNMRKIKNTGIKYNTCLNQTTFNFLHHAKHLSKNKYNLYYQLKNIHQINPILLSYGQHFFEYGSFLSLIKNKYIHCPIKKHKNTLLHIIQQDITNVIRKDKTNQTHTLNKTALYKKDKSIEIHICNSMKKEIEILHNNLLNILNNNSDLFPKNILVTVIQLNLYIPFIQAIFKEQSHTSCIPFMIFNELSNDNNEILFNFKKLINIGKKRFYNKEIFSLITSSSLIKKFNIKEKEIPILCNIIHESGIQWGLDAYHLKCFRVSHNIKNTWEEGIKRMMLGYAIHDVDKTYDHIVPYPINSPLKIKIVSKLIKFITTLYKWQKKLSTAKLLKSWLPLCNELINDFFYINEENNDFLDEIKKKWEKIINTGIKYKYKKKFLFQY